MFLVTNKIIMSLWICRCFNILLKSHTRVNIFIFIVRDQKHLIYSESRQNKIDVQSHNKFQHYKRLCMTKAHAYSSRSFDFAI